MRLGWRDRLLLPLLGCGACTHGMEPTRKANAPSWHRPKGVSTPHMSIIFLRAPRAAEQHSPPPGVAKPSSPRPALLLLRFLLRFCSSCELILCFWTP